MAILHGKRVLIVDADVLLAVDLAHELAIRGSELPIVAPDPQRALAAADASNLDVAVIDPTLNGISVITAAQRLMDRKIPVVITSPWPRENLPPTLAACSFVRKPYATRVVLGSLIQTLQGQRLVQVRPTMDA